MLTCVNQQLLTCKHQLICGFHLMQFTELAPSNYFLLLLFYLKSIGLFIATLIKNNLPFARHQKTAAALDATSDLQVFCHQVMLLGVTGLTAVILHHDHDGVINEIFINWRNTEVCTETNHRMLKERTKCTITTRKGVNELLNTTIDSNAVNWNSSDVFSIYHVR